eukprot:5697335-Amphidinium_carterae.2
MKFNDLVRQEQYLLYNWKDRAVHEFAKDVGNCFFNSLLSSGLGLVLSRRPIRDSSNNFPSAEMQDRPELEEIRNRFEVEFYSNLGL